MIAVRLAAQQQGGVPLQVLHKGLNAAWRNLQDQHSKLEAKAQVRTAPHSPSLLLARVSADHGYYTL